MRFRVLSHHFQQFTNLIYASEELAVRKSFNVLYCFLHYLLTLHPTFLICKQLFNCIHLIILDEFVHNQPVNINLASKHFYQLNKHIKQRWPLVSLLLYSLTALHFIYNIKHCSRCSLSILHQNLPFPFVLTVLLFYNLQQ